MNKPIVYNRTKDGTITILKGLKDGGLMIEQFGRKTTSMNEVILTQQELLRFLSDATSISQSTDKE